MQQNVLQVFSYVKLIEPPQQPSETESINEL